METESVNLAEFNFAQLSKAELHREILVYQFHSVRPLNPTSGNATPLNVHVKRELNESLMPDTLRR